MLEQGYNYGIRTGRPIDGQQIGEIHSRGRQVVGIGSTHAHGTRYTLKGR
ncbi:2197_t:CDS:2, partial [Ambispora gerdemannii]